MMNNKYESVPSVLGAIAGDIIGSVYEFRGAPSKEKILLFGPNAKFTDDTVLTVAIADWLLHPDMLTAQEALLNYGRKYVVGYGPSFLRWLCSSAPQPYNSCGNGSAMRSSAVGWIASNVDECLDLASQSALPTHNHLEGIKGAQALALAVFYAREKKDKAFIRQEIATRFGYDLDRTSEQILQEEGGYKFRVLCQNTVPEAIIAFLESDRFEDAAVRAMLTNKDCDTAACIACAIAGAYYGIPQYIVDQTLDRLAPPMRTVMEELEKKVGIY